MADVVLQYLKQIEDLKYVGYMIIILCGLHTMASCILFIYTSKQCNLCFVDTLGPAKTVLIIKVS